MSVDSFCWEMEKDGYKFATVSIPASHDVALKRILVSRATGDVNMGYLSLSETSVLWREFVELELTEYDIETFASKYGKLFLGKANFTNEQILAVHDDDLNVPTRYPVFLNIDESFDAWCENILEMKRLSFIWDLFQKGDILALQRYIHKTARNPHVWTFVSRPEIFELHEAAMIEDVASKRKLIAQKIESMWGKDDFYEDFFLHEFAKPKLMDAVQHLILLKVNKRLEGVHPRLLWDISKPLSKHLDLRLTANCLADALWLQFAQAVTRGTKFERCDRCKKWFAKVDRNSEKKIYCSNACKQATYRKKKNLQTDIETE
jgi:hypothetical protein